MAQHIDSVAGSPIPKVSKEAFYLACKPGMPIFCSGRYPISLGIEQFTGSPFSHVATLLYMDSIDRWGVLEATVDHGVHIGHLDYYVDRYEGDLILCSTPGLVAADYPKLLQQQFDLVDDPYDTGDEALMVAHKLIACVPLKASRKDYFCSGLYEQGRRATSLPLTCPGPAMATPEQVWQDPSIIPVCCLLKS